MIVEWLFDLVATVVDWFFSLFNGLEVPSWLSTPPSDLALFVSNFSSMGVWVPWDILAAVISAVVAAYASLFIVKLVKQVAAHIPGFGGAG